jgi:nucleoid-associated protein YgaU
VQKGDTLPAIAKAYREQGVKVTTTQILKANPGIDANKILIGQKIFIPDPNAK